jgi:hypothetical protein
VSFGEFMQNTRWQLEVAEDNYMAFMEFSFCTRFSGARKILSFTLSRVATRLQGFFNVNQAKVSENKCVC